MKAWYSSKTYGRRPCSAQHFRHAIAGTYLRVHDIGRDIGIRDMLAEFAAELCLDLLELDRCKTGTRPPVNLGLVTNDLATKWLWETSDGLTKVALEELDNRGREVKLVSAIQNVLLREVVLDHPLRKVSDDLRRGRDL